MYGAIIGDLAGSIYEYNQTINCQKLDIDKIIEPNSFISDDTILTIAILDAILNKKDGFIDYKKYLREYIYKYREYTPHFSPYFKTPFSKKMMEWAEKGDQRVSSGNGAMMRISPVGYMFNTEEEVIENAKLATIPSHNDPIAKDCAKNIALIIYYFRQGKTKEWVFNKLNLNPQYIPFTTFNYTCENTIGNCLYALFVSNSFEDAIIKTVNMGGDTDTNAAIVGSMAEALYGINPEIINLAEERILSNNDTKDLLKVLKKSNYYNK